MPRLAWKRNRLVAFTVEVLLHRYMAREVGGVLLVAAPAIFALIGVLQSMRLAPLLAGADVGILEAVEVLGLLLIPLASLSLPAAAVISLLAALARLEADGELVALRAAGAGTARLGTAPMAICAVVALATGFNSLVGEPAAYGRLEVRMADLLARGALGQIRPAVITEPSPGLTVLVRQRRGDRLEGVFIEDRRGEAPVQLFARSAELEPLRGRTELRLELSEGELQSRRGDGGLTRTSFDRLETTLVLDDAARELSAVVPSRLGRWPRELARDAHGPDRARGREAELLLHRRAAAGPTALGLCLLTLLLGLWKPLRGRLVLIALTALLFLTSHLLFRAGEAAVGAGALDPALGGWLSAATIWAAAVIWVVFPRISKLFGKV